MYLANRNGHAIHIYNGKSTTVTKVYYDRACSIPEIKMNLSMSLSIHTILFIHFFRNARTCINDGLNDLM